ncbi:MAG: phosphate ABC transporter substrate-binding protein PstS [Acetobacteraceae bacterium]|nr:phosphate ABC transporter substrate-binding protein PstS [Acetobacteraceae bacterium]
MQRRSFLAASGAVVGAHLAGRAALAQQAQAKGAGAGFRQQVLSAWGDAAKASNGGGVRVGYDVAGTNDGIAKVVSREVDFAGTAAPMSAGRLRDRHLVQFPCMAGPVVFTANLPGVAVDELKLTGDAIADLYLGRIKRWNDPKLAEHNPGLRLPDLAVTPVYRSDISGTTLLATTFLSRASETWRDGGPRAGTVVLWPVGKGGHMNEGVAEAVGATPGAIGYVTNPFAVSKRLAAAQLRNRSGAFVKPQAASFQAAVDAADWGAARNFAADMVDLDGAAAWPIMGPGFVLVPADPDAEKAGGVRNALRFFDWALDKGRDATLRAGCAPLPDAVTKAVREAWGAVKAPDGQPLWKG